MRVISSPVRSSAVLKIAATSLAVSTVRFEAHNFDDRTETFEWTTPALPPGEHTATLNVTDREGNTSTRKIVFVIGENSRRSADQD